MSLDHGFENVSNCRDLAIAHLATRSVCACDPICDRKNSTQVIRRVTPFSSQPAVIVVQPSDHCTNIERTVYRVELEGRTRHSSAIGDFGIWNEGAKDGCTLGE